MSCNILAEKKCVTPSCFRQRDRKQRYARLFQIPGKRSAVKVEFLGEDRCCYVLSRELPDFVRWYELGKTVPNTGRSGEQPLIS